MLEGLTTVSQGNVGLGVAIGYFCMLNYVVSIPLNDNQAYDLVVDFGEDPKTVQVKTSRFKSKNGNYIVALKRSHHNKTENQTRPFDNRSVDFVFVLTGDGQKYLIPSLNIAAKLDVTLGSAYEQYRIGG